MMDIPYIEMAKIQSLIVIPLIKAFEKKIGKEEAHAVVRSVIDQTAYREGIDFWPTVTGAPAERISQAAGYFARMLDETPAIVPGPLEITETDTDTEIKFDVRNCQYAEFYKSIDETEIGELLMCYADFPRSKGWGDGISEEQKKVGVPEGQRSKGITLGRKATMMCGADKCDMHWKIGK